MLIKIIPEIGHFALVIALLMAVVQAVMQLQSSHVLVQVLHLPMLVTQTHCRLSPVCLVC